MGSFTELKDFFRRRRREGSSRAATDGAPTSSGNSRQEQSVDIPMATDGVKETPPRSLKDSHHGQRSVVGSTEKAPITQERKQSSANPSPGADAKELEYHTSPPSESKSTRLVNPAKRDEDAAVTGIQRSVNEETHEAQISQSSWPNSSNRSPVASREISPRSRPLWSPETYSQRLWNLAYDLLKAESGEIVEQYESAILAYIRAAEENEQEFGLGRLSGIVQSNKTESSGEDHEQITNPLRMTKFLELFLPRSITSERFGNSVDNHTRSNANEIESREYRRIMYGLNRTIQICPHAYIPWVATCFAIEWLLHTARSGQTHDHRSAISIVCSMEYYIGLSNLLFHPQGDPSRVPDEGSREWSLVLLYKTILLHQIQTGLNDLGQDTEQYSTSGAMYSSAPVMNEQEIKEKEKAFMCFNMQEIENNLASWLDRATSKSLEGPDVDGSSQQSSQHVGSDVDGSSQHSSEEKARASDVEQSSHATSHRNDTWKDWDVAKQPLVNLDNFASRPFDELYELVQKTNEFQHFVSWNSEPRGRVLFLDADLETGKTDLLRVMRRNLSTPRGEDPVGTVNAILFSPDRSSPDRNNLSFLLRSLIFRVLEQQSLLSLADTEKKHFNSPADFYALKMMFYSLLRSENFQPTYLVIDSLESLAIDNIEYPSVGQKMTSKNASPMWGLKDLMDMIASTTRDSENIRWLISSRKNELATSGSDLDNCHHQVSITRNASEVTEILARYSASCVSEMVQSRSHENSINTKEIYEAMQQPPHRSLLWINTALNILRRDPAYWNAPTTFRGLIDSASNMNALYEKAKEDIYKLREKDKEYCLNILSILAFAYRPLSTSELRDIASLPVEISITVLVQEFLPLFLKISNNNNPDTQTVDFVHPSAKEFIRPTPSSSNLTDLSDHEKSFANYHETLAARCLHILVSSLSTYNSAASANKTLQQDRPYNEYAMIFWIRHLLQMGEEAEGEIKDLVSRLVTSLRNQWLEAIDSIGLLPEALVMITDGNIAMEAATKSPIDGTNNMYRVIQETGEFIRVHLEWTAALRDDTSDDGHKKAPVSNSFMFWPTMRPSWLAQSPAWNTRNYIPESCLRVMEHPDWVRGCAFSPCGRLVATGADDHLIRLWDTESGTFQHVLGDVGGFVYCLSISQSGPTNEPLLATCSARTVKIWNLSTGSTIKEINVIENIVESKTEAKALKAVTFEHGLDGTANRDDEDERSDESGDASDSSSTQARSNFQVEKIDISPGGDYLVALVNHSLALWKTSTFECTILHEMDVNKSLNSVRFSTDGQHVAASVGSDIITCDVPTMDWETHEHGGVHWLPTTPKPRSSSPEATSEEVEINAEQEDSTGSDGERSETSSTRSKPPEQYPGHSAPIFGLCYSPDREGRGLLASGSDDRTARIWNLETRMTEVIFKYHENDVNSVSFSADGLCLATASSDMKIGIWNQVSPGNWGTGVRTKPVKILAGHVSMVWSVNFAPQGHRLVSCGNDSKALVWEINTDSLKLSGSELQDEPTNPISESVEGPGVGHFSRVTCVSVSPDGTVIASGSSAGQICLWNGTTGAHISTMTEAHDRTVLSIVFSADGETLVSTSSDESAFVWSVNDTTKKAECHLKGHDDWVRGAAISPDKGLVATACDDRAVRVYDISVFSDPPSDAENSSSRLIQPRVFQGHEDYVYSVAFSPDGRYLASAGDDGIVMFWDLTSQGDKRKPDKELNGRVSDWWRGIVFTPDGDCVLTVSNRGVVVMWEPHLQSTEEGQCLAILHEAETFETMRINPDQPDVLITNTGAWRFKVSKGEEERSDTETSSLQLQRLPNSLGISEDNRWITWDETNLILLPLKFRPTEDKSSRWVQSRYVVIGCKSGQVLLFKLAEDSAPTVPTASLLKI